jgi:hypothetical protein
MIISGFRETSFNRSLKVLLVRLTTLLVNIVDQYSNFFPAVTKKKITVIQQLLCQIILSFELSTD